MPKPAAMALKAVNTRTACRAQRTPLTGAPLRVVSQRLVAVRAVSQKEQAVNTTSQTYMQSGLSKRTLLAGIAAVAATTTTVAG